MNEPKDAAVEGEGGFLKEELLLSTRVEKDDIYARQQGQSLVNVSLRMTGRYCLWQSSGSGADEDRNAHSMDGTNDSAGYRIIIPGSRWV